MLDKLSNKMRLTTLLSSSRLWMVLLSAGISLCIIHLYTTHRSKHQGLHFTNEDIETIRTLDVIEPGKPEPVGQQLIDEEKRLLAEYYNLTQTITYQCKNRKRYGNQNDGGWEICLDAGFQIQAPCLVYSFGINNDFSFDDSIDKQMGCEIHAYDPSMAVNDHKRGKNINFHKVGISNEDSRQVSWIMRKVSSLIHGLGHQNRIIDYMKMDVEYSEWKAMEKMLEEDVFKNIRQFAVEIHLPSLDILGYGHVRYEPLKRLTRILRSVKHAGFEVYHNHANPMGLSFNKVLGVKKTCCDEVYYINKRFLPQVAQTAAKPAK
ncbi:putative methyltransferase-like protein 24 isoform X2 [Tubulanus polymorphus]|uniref:putative methyltransferase-like protein 24 isoform X2 n=1 Tax=Tubulanus polymorphus TaxID=672921 RepID=UPI003DA2BB2B